MHALTEDGSGHIAVLNVNVSAWEGGANRETKTCMTIIVAIVRGNPCTAVSSNMIINELGGLVKVCRGDGSKSHSLLSASRGSFRVTNFAWNNNETGATMGTVRMLSLIITVMAGIGTSRRDHQLDKSVPSTNGGRE